jgi:hypothetical protein
MNHPILLMKAALLRTIDVTGVLNLESFNHIYRRDEHSPQRSSILRVLPRNAIFTSQTEINSNSNSFLASSHSVMEKRHWGSKLGTVFKGPWPSLILIDMNSLNGSEQLRHVKSNSCLARHGLKRQAYI